jgi:hypothetical protein
MLEIKEKFKNLNTNKKQLKYKVNSKDIFLKHLKYLKKSLIKFNINLNKSKLKKKKLYKKIVYNKIYKFKKYKFKKTKFSKKKRFFNTRISLKQYKNNFFATFSLRNSMKRYYSTGLFFQSGPKKSSTYAAQLVGKLMGRFIKKMLRKYKFKLKIRKLCLSLKTKKNAFTYACLKGVYRSRIWFGVLDPCRKIPHGYIRLRKPRSL